MDTQPLLIASLLASLSLNIILVAKALWPLCRLILLLAVWVWRYALWGWRFERVLLSVRNARKLQALRDTKPLTPMERDRMNAEIRSLRTLELAILDPVLEIYFSDSWKGPRGPRCLWRMMGYWRLFRFADKPSEFRKTFAHYDSQVP